MDYDGDRHHHFRACYAKSSISASGVQNVVETILEALEGQLSPTLGKHWPMVSSLLFTFFLFIFVGNELGLLPTLHAVTSPTADINTTAALALCSSFIVWGMGIKVKGLSYFNHFLQPYKAMLVLNIFEEIAKPITLAFRLFGNIVAGEILLEILYNLPWLYLYHGFGLLLVYLLVSFKLLFLQF